MEIRRRFLVCTYVGKSFEWDFEKCAWPPNAEIFDTLNDAKDFILSNNSISAANILKQIFLKFDGEMFFATPKVLHMVMRGYIKDKIYAHTYSNTFCTTASETDLYIQEGIYLNYEEALNKAWY